MTKTLVAYCSLSGKTAELAEAVAAELQADLERIEEPEPRSVLGVLWSMIELALGYTPEIKPPVRDPEAYDLIVLGSPVWGATMAPPMRTYLTEIRDREPKEAAYFVTASGSGMERALSKMELLLGRPAQARLGLTNKDRVSDAWRLKTQAFVAKLVDTTPR